MKTYFRFLIGFFAFLLPPTNGKAEQYFLSSGWKMKVVKTKTSFPIPIDFAPSAFSAMRIILNEFYDMSPNQLPEYWLANEQARIIYNKIIQPGIELSCNFSVEEEVLAKKIIQLRISDATTFCDVFLNSKKIGSTANAFRIYRFDIKKHLKKGLNHIMFRFHHPEQFLKGKIKKSDPILPADNQPGAFKYAPYVRQAQQDFGWDFCEPHPYLGLKSFPIIQYHEYTTFADHWVDQLELQSDSSLTFRLNIELECAKDIPVTIDLNPEIFSRYSASITLKKGKNYLQFSGNLKNPPFWYPAGSPELFGSNFKYRKNQPASITATIYDEKKNIVFTGNEKLYVSINRLEQKKDEIGESFGFNVNGKPVFIRGINLVLPNPSGLTHYSWNGITNEPLSDRLKQAILSSKINMIRIWGGGSYLPDSFYDWADENGIMIWQDFMFAGSMYPSDPAFLANVEAEVEDQIRRLRKHACLALWCGNNEIDVARKNWGWQKKYNYTPDQERILTTGYNKLFKEIIPRKIRELDSGRAYIESSPLSNWGKPEELNSGNNHYWAIWHGEQPISSFKENIPRFATEYGLPSLPSKKVVLDRLGNPNAGKEYLKEMLISYKGIDLLEKYITNNYRKPLTLDDWIYLSQYTQAKALKTAIIAHRTSIRCSGTMPWQLNDAAATISWSLFDLYNLPKPAFFTLKKYYQPEILYFEKSNSDISIYNNVLGMSFSNKLIVQLMHRDGEVLYSENLSIDRNLPEGTRKLFTIPKSWNATSHPKNELFLVATLYDANIQLFREIFLLVDEKDFNWKTPDVLLKTPPESDPKNEFRITPLTLISGFFLPEDTSNPYMMEDLLPGEDYRMIMSPKDLKEWQSRAISVNSMMIRK